MVVIGHPRDEHCDQVQQALADMGEGDEIARVSLEMLPASRFQWTPNGPLRLGDNELHPGRCAGIFRRPGVVDTTHYDPLYSGFVASESSDAFYGALEAIRIRWLSHPTRVLSSERKLMQLRVAAESGIPIPRTVVTNRIDDAVSLRDLDLIVKPVRYGLLGAKPEPLVAFSQAIIWEDMRDLSGSPVIVQERIAAAYHLRVTVVGDDVFAAALPADLQIDWRSHPENHQRFEVRDLPDAHALNTMALLMQERLGLRFSAQDWILTPDERYVFLEGNPSGQWLFVDPLCGGKITQSVASQMVALRGLAA